MLSPIRKLREVDARLLAEEWGMWDIHFELINAHMILLSERLGLPIEILRNSLSIAMYSVEWSEHCCYGRSRKLLGLLPRKGKYPVLVGQDCGGFEIGDGLVVVFKMESHNHPSAIEPYQGAATGIGGIIRDILTVGIRPIALLDSLRFGPLSDPRTRYLFSGVVSGISGYGNCVGIPTVGGESYFAPCYEHNCLVNVMCVGVGRKDSLVTSAASGIGNSVLYVGADTGPDGVGGCSVLASHVFGEEVERRTIQIGNPFLKKVLIEAYLEAAATGAIVAAKDMGAAGLTCTTSEVSAAGGVGMDIDLSLVPLRVEEMEVHDVLMSESQERMLLVVERGREEEVIAIFQKWYEGLQAVKIGEVISEPYLRLRRDGELIAIVDVQHLTGGPSYDLPVRKPEYLEQVQAADVSVLPVPEDLNKVLLALLGSPNIASKQCVFRQYDQSVLTNTVVSAGEGDAAVLRIKGTRKAIAVTSDCNSRYCYLGPREGARIAVAEAARNLACVGAEPVGITDCLNFGHPDRPEIFWAFTECVEGITEAATALELAVVSGNVSFFNETGGEAIWPTPTIGMVGLLPDVTHHCTAGFKQAGDLIVLLGLGGEGLGGSEYLQVIHGRQEGKTPFLDLHAEKNLQQLCLAAIREGLLSSAHDVSEGGLVTCLAECAILGSLGASVQIWDADIDALFGESCSRIVVSLPSKNFTKLSELAAPNGVSIFELGKVGGERLRVENSKGSLIERSQVLVDLMVEELARVWYRAIPECLGLDGSS